MKARPEILNGVPVPYGLQVSELEALVESNQRERWAALIALGHDACSEALAALTTAARHSAPPSDVRALKHWHSMCAVGKRAKLLSMGLRMCQ
jgi:hypothetical protein